LDQEKSETVREFFNVVPSEKLNISDFSLHSIGVILSRFKKPDILASFISDLFINAQINQLSLLPVDFMDIIANIEKFNLDFDDAYQLTVAQKYKLTIVTFDKDFKPKGIDNKSPEEVLNIIKNQ
jgi:predicted nucleic acid-binding protein